MPVPSYRLAVLADIHGNQPAFEAVMADIKRHGSPDAILVAGDITGGPGQQAILQRLFEAQAIMIQGNGEQAIAQLANHSAPQAYFTTHQFSLIRWAHEHLSPEQRALGLPSARTTRCGAARLRPHPHGAWVSP